jgi:hypothetical protein
MNGTANNYMAGNLGIGTTSLGALSGNLNMAIAITGGTQATAINVSSVVQSDVTAAGYYFRAINSTAAASFTTSNLVSYLASQGTIGAGSTVSSQKGFWANSSLVGGATNTAFQSSIPVSGLNNWNFYADGTAPNYMAGALGIGSTALTGYNLRVSKNITGATTAYGVSVDGVIQSDVTTQAWIFQSNVSTAAASFNVAGGVRHFFARGVTLGAGSIMGNQFGFYAEGSLTTGSSNFGFYGDIPSGTNRWNLYMNGTANNYMAGSLGIGSTALINISLRIAKNTTGSTTSIGLLNEGTIQSDVTTLGVYYSVNASTAAATFTLTNLFHYNANQATFGAGSTVTTQTGFNVGSSLIGATNNYGFRGQIPSGTNRWNLYMDGTAANYLAGTLSIGGTTINSNAVLQINSNLNQPQNIVVSNSSSLSAAQCGIQVISDGGIASFNAYSSTFATTELQSSALLSSGSSANGLIITTATTAPIRLRTNSIERVRIKQTGQMRFVPLASDPSGAEAGDIYYNSTISALKLYDGTVWRTITVV